MKTTFKVSASLSILVTPFVFNLVSCTKNIEYMSCLGDSITGGYNINEPNNRMVEPYPTLLEEQIHNLNTTNLSECGATLSYVNGHSSIVDQYTLIPKNTNIISVMGGTNDYGFNADLGALEDNTPKTTCGSINFLLDHIKEQNPHAFLFFITPIKMEFKVGPNERGFELFDYVAAIKQVCYQNQVLVLDLYNLCDPTNDFMEPTSDKVHPSQSFVKEKIAPAIIDFLQKNYLK